MKGNLHVKDAVANINSLTASTMGGTVSVNGNYDTRDTLNPKAAVKMNVNKMSISEVFSTVRTAKRMVPLLSDASGEFTMEMDFSSAMDATLSPIMNTINAKGRMSSKEVTLKNVEVFNNIAETAKFNALKDPKLKNINIAFSIKDGRLYADPFETMISSALMNVSGSSGLDKTLDYTAKLTLPQNVSSAVDLAFDILIGGTFTKPTIKMSAASILNQVKEKVVEKIDEAKQKAVAEATAQKEKLIKTAKAQKAMLVSKAQQSADKAIEKAQKESDNLVAKAANPIAKAAAKKSGEVMIKKARTEADKMIKDAESQGDKLVKDAESQGDEMIKKASQTSIKQ